MKNIDKLLKSEGKKKKKKKRKNDEDEEEGEGSPVSAGKSHKKVGTTNLLV